MTNDKLTSIHLEYGNYFNGHNLFKFCLESFFFKELTRKLLMMWRTHRIDKFKNFNENASYVRIEQLGN